MGAVINITMLLASVFTLLVPSVSSLGLGLVERQNRVIDTTPTIEACSTGYDCTMAATWWADCQNAHVLGMPQDPSSNVRWCLCPPSRSVPSHVDWFAKLRNCILCVEMVIGNQGPGGYLSSQMETLAGSPNSFIGYCHNSFDTTTFIQKTRALVAAKEFPLALPEAILPGNSGTVPRSDTAIVLTTSMPTGSHSSTVRIAPLSGIASTHSSSAESCESSKISTSHQYTVVQSASAASACSHDNCLRQAIRYAPAVSSFCDSYTRAINTATVGIPQCLSACKDSPASVSSACSCLATYTSSISLASTTKASISTPSPATTIKSSGLSSSSLHSASTSLSTSSSGIPTGIPSLITTQLAPTTSRTSTVSSGIATTNQSTATHSYTTSKVAISSSTSGVVGHPTKWATLPASDEIRSCAGSSSCRNAQMYFNQCMVMKSDTEMWQCFCRTYEAPWKASLNTCVACIEDALPHYSDNPPMLADIKVNIDYFCNYTRPYQAVSRQRLLDEGADLTNMYQSPIELFNMSLIDREYKLGDPQPPAAAPSLTPGLPASPESGRL